MRRVLPFLALVACGAPLAAPPPDTIFRCTDADGHLTYQSSDGPQCRRVDGLVASIPASDLPRSERAQSNRASVTAASFPRVDARTQRVRDLERRRILEEELRAEQDRLLVLQAQLREGPGGLSPAADPGRTPAERERAQRLNEDIERSQGNIASLRRELAPVRY